MMRLQEKRIKATSCQALQALDNSLHYGMSVYLTKYVEMKIMKFDQDCMTNAACRAA